MLYVVSTPIGNLDDITLRALETLKNVDLVACEDTRHTKILLDKHSIPFCHSGDGRTPESDSGQARMTSRSRLVSYHQHSGSVKTEKILTMLKDGKDVALVTDAGTPGISDPGSKLVAEAAADGIEITSIPGPAAFVSALSVSGFDTSEFIFIGFLPHKKGRQTKLKEISGEKRTVVLYESVHRIKKLFGELSEIIPNREICVCRELTKKFEEIYRGKPSELMDQIIEKGEFAVVIGGRND